MNKLNELLNHVEKELTTKDKIDEIAITDQLEEIDTLQVGDNIYLWSILHSLNDNPDFEESTKIEMACEDFKLFCDSVKEELKRNDYE